MDVLAGKQRVIFPLVFTCLILSVLLFDGFLCTQPFSWELASVLKESKGKFDSAGVKLIAVGVGTPIKARILSERVLSFLFHFHFLFVSLYLQKIFMNMDRELNLIICGMSRSCGWISVFR